MNKKNLVFAGILSLGMLFAACSETKTDTAKETKENPEMKGEEKEKAVPKAYGVNTSESLVKWKGYIAGVKEHTGTLGLSEAKVTVTGDMVTGGSFEVDMTTMKATDSNYTEEQPSEMLLGHLSSAEFFDVANHNKATFVINGNSENSVRGDLTVRGVTKPAVVEDVVITTTGKNKVVTGVLTFDRQEFGVAYTGAKDFLISDDVELGIKLALR